jgi:hypothetical protein
LISRENVKAYKAEGDGFQRDVLCQESYINSFYYENQSTLKNYHSQDLSPLHACVMFLFAE